MTGTANQAASPENRGSLTGLQKKNQNIFQLINPNQNYMRRSILNSPDQEKTLSLNSLKKTKQK